ncbi:MAG: major capsid protein, partial [bacterium]
MPRGASTIPDLRLSRLNKLVSKFATPESFVLSNIFGTGMAAESDTIKWESVVGNRGMAPFKPPKAPSPNTSPDGVTAHEAHAAFWGEKIFYGEEFLNNLRRMGTESQYETAQAHLARGLMMLKIRNDRRLEWMWSQIFSTADITVSESTGQKWTVSYGVPSDHEVSLGTTYKWEAGANKDIVKDIMDGKIKVHDDCGAMVTDAICNSTVFKFMVLDESIQTLLMESAFGRNKGDLFKKGNNII